MLKVYADETGTHDGSDVVVLTGLIESREYWLKFNRQWKAVLDNYDAKFFHYREFREVANLTPEDPYFGWSNDKRRNFLFRLAMVVGESAVPTGGAYAVERNTKLGITKNPFDEAIRSFFGSTIAMLDKHWPDYTGKLLFVFDKTTNREWLDAIRAIHGEYKEKDLRVGDMVFEDDKDARHLGLQAADFSGMHFRNAARQYVQTEGREIDVRIIDFLVHKNQDVAFRQLSKEKTKKLIEDMRGHESQIREKGFAGAYFPLRDFPFKDYGYQP
jgi:hypothetical protein